MTMKISKDTIKVLENYSDISDSILIKPGNVIKTICPEEIILAEAEVSEDFPKAFAIYELKKFLRGLVIQNNPELDFEESDSYVIIRDGRHKLKYYYCDLQFVKDCYDVDVNTSEESINFRLEHSQLDRLIKTTSVYTLPNICIVCNDGVIKVIAKDRENPTSTEFSIEVGESNRNLDLTLKPENLKIIPGSYDVCLYEEARLLKFYSESKKLTYHIAMEQD